MTPPEMYREKKERELRRELARKGKLRTRALVGSRTIYGICPTRKTPKD
jgi:hypothetical protein